jgi:ribonuclease HI
LKLNCDASFKPENISGSWGSLIRDHDGDVVLTGRGKLKHALSAFQAALISYLQGVQAAANFDVGKLILDTDALMVQQAMRSDTFDAMPEG